MKAWVIHEFGGKEVMQIEEVEKPRAGENEIVIAAEYSAINPVDWKIREGMLEQWLQHPLPAILGWDIAGVVEEVGSHVEEFKAGDLVYALCRGAEKGRGTFAEFALFSSDWVSPIPYNITLSQAASLPLVTLTAWQALFSFSSLAEGDVVLIHAGAGGVGSMAIQLAKYGGAKVITTASRGNFDYVLSLGADEVIDYREQDFVDEVKRISPSGVDIVFDCVGGKTFHRSADLVKRGGSLVSICTLIDETYGAPRGIKSGYLLVEPNGQQLREIARLIEKELLFVPHIAEYPFNQVPEALEKNREGHTKGKIVVAIRK